MIVNHIAVCNEPREYGLNNSYFSPHHFRHTEGKQLKIHPTKNITARHLHRCNFPLSAVMLLVNTILDTS